MSILECKGLSKRFGAVTALDGISFTIEPGRIVGLLGPNGSGKTTLIKLANGLLVPTAGELWINGRAPGKESHAMVSYLPERTSLPLWMTVKQLQDFYEDFYADFQRERSEEMLDRLEISAKQRMKHMSKGTREKVQLILAMSRQAKLYLLDEPIGGVDPAARDYILDTIIRNYNPEASVIISTHLIADVEKVLDEVLFIDRGQILLQSSVDAIREEKGMSVDALFRGIQMLRKLLKHEFRATARVMIPLYLITVLLAVLTRATALWAEMVTFDGMLGRNFLALLSGIIIFGFVLALIATFVVAVILAILRFRSNLMADEGYVMFTLPVSTHTLVWSKLIVSAVWFLGAVVVDVLSLLALVANVEMFWELGRVFQEIADQWNAYYVGNGVAFLVECLLLFLVFCVVACLEFYTPLAIGHSFAQHKMLLSVAFFFAIQVVTQIVSGMLLFAGVPMLDSMDGWLNSLTPATAIHGFMWGSILISAIYGAILYCITIRMLHRHLNLE